jgi:hypothetical protein
MSNQSNWTHWELIFDKDGNADAPARTKLLDALATSDLTDVVFFSHGWNNDQRRARDLYARWLAMLPPLLPAASTANVRTVGIIWPSMQWADEPIPNFPEEAGGVATLDDHDPLRDLLDATYGGDPKKYVFDAAQRKILAKLSALLAEPPTSDDEIDGALETFQGMLRSLAKTEGTRGAAAEDDGATAMLDETPRDLAKRFVQAKETGGAVATTPDDGGGIGGGIERGFDDGGGVEGGFDGDGGEASLSDAGRRLWGGAKEVARQFTYWQMKRRAGVVGEHGLGPLLTELQHRDGNLRVHLLGHSFGARLVSFSLKGIPDDASSPVCSLTMLQGAYSHNAFATNLEWGTGALAGQQSKVRGPITACFSTFDMAVGKMYPLASMAAGDATAAVQIQQARWGGMGHDGAQDVNAKSYELVEGATVVKIPSSGFVNVDAKSVVRTGHFPSGAHSDIFHPELAAVLMAASGLVP